MQELMQQLREQGVEAEAFHAVDGRQHTPDLLPGERIDQNQSLKIRQTKLTNSEIGCYLSQLRAMKQAYEEGLPRVCIMEEDVMVENDFGAVLAAIAALPDDVELVRLMGLKIHPRKLVMPLGASHQLTRPVKGLCGAQGYVINREGMSKVIEHGSTIAEAIDKFFDHFWNIDLRCYCVEPHVVWERPSSSTVEKNMDPKTGGAIANTLRKHWIKVVRSNKRRAYLRKHRDEFHPAIPLTEKAGRTERIH